MTITTSKSIYTQATALMPSFDGVILVELADEPVKYHFAHTVVDGPDAMQCHSLMMASCRLACKSAEAVRGRSNLNQFNRAMTTTCIDRLRTMQYLMEHIFIAQPRLKAQLCYLPIVPNAVHALLVAKDSVETVVMMTVGERKVIANMTFRFMGSRWMCTFADIG